jgi:hypothetical protein
MAFFPPLGVATFSVLRRLGWFLVVDWLDLHNCICILSYCPSENAPLFTLHSTHTAALGVTVAARDWLTSASEILWLIYIHCVEDISLLKLLIEVYTDLF